MKAATPRPPALTPKKRCAIYPRKSTDEGLDQEYNSLEAQRDSALTLISSQRHEGWLAIDDGYDDGGFSGGNTNRPSLKRLLDNVEDGRIDVVVVYKIDRHGVTFIVGNAAVQHHQPLPALEIEAAVLTQVHKALQEPEMIVGVWQAGMALREMRDLAESTVLVAMLRTVLP